MQIMQLDTPEALLGPALGVQHFLDIHPFVNCGEESGFLSGGVSVQVWFEPLCC